MQDRKRCAAIDRLLQSTGPENEFMKSMTEPGSGIRRPALALTLLCSLVVSGNLAAASDCKAIRFKPGTSAAKIHGTVQADERQCYRFGTGKGQSVRLAVQSASGDVAFTIDDLVDNRDEFEFTSEKKTYELNVYQTTRSVTPEDFTLSLSIK